MSTPYFLEVRRHRRRIRPGRRDPGPRAGARRQAGAAAGARHRSPTAQLLRHLPGRADLFRPHEPALHRGRAEHRAAADGRRRDEHVLRLRCAPTGLAQGQVRRGHRRRSLRDDRRAGDRAAARRPQRAGLHPHRPGRPGAGLRLAAAAQVHASQPRVACASASSAGPGACSAVAAAPSGTPPSTWTKRLRPAPTCGHAPASSVC